MKSVQFYRAHFLWLCLALLVPALAYATGIVSGGIVQGRVVDRAGNPLKDIGVTLAGAQELTATHTETSPGFSEEGGRLRAGGGSVSGHIKEKRGEAERTYRAKTNKKGMFVIHAEVGHYELTVDDPDYGLDKITVRIQDEKRKPVDEWGGRAIPGQPPPGFSVHSRHTIEIDLVAADRGTLNKEHSHRLLASITKQLDQGHNEQATETVEALLRTSPGDPLGLTLRAHIHLENGDYDKAEADLGAALENDPDLEDAQYLLGTLYHRTGRTGEATKMLRSLAESSSNSSISSKAWLSIAEIERDADNPETRLAALEKAVEASPELKPMLAPEIAAVYSSLGNVEKAEHWLGEGGSEEASDPTVLYNIAVNHFNASRYEPAIAAFRKVVEADPGFAEAYRDLGWALVNQGQMDEAKVSFGKYLELSPDAVDAEEIKGILEALGG